MFLLAQNLGFFRIWVCFFGFQKFDTSSLTCQESNDGQARRPGHLGREKDEKMLLITLLSFSLLLSLSLSLLLSLSLIFPLNFGAEEEEEEKLPKK